MLEPVQLLESHARKMFSCVKCARCGVVFTLSVAYKRNRCVPANETLEKTSKTTNCAHNTCHPVDDRHIVEDEDHEVDHGHRVQPVLGSTDHATDWIFLWQHDLWRELCVAGIVALGVVGLEDRPEWWD